MLRIKSSNARKLYTLIKLKNREKVIVLIKHKNFKRISDCLKFCWPENKNYASPKSPCERGFKNICFLDQNSYIFIIMIEKSTYTKYSDRWVRTDTLPIYIKRVFVAKHDPKIAQKFSCTRARTKVFGSLAQLRPN